METISTNARATGGGEETSPVAQNSVTVGALISATAAISPLHVSAAESAAELAQLQRDMRGAPTFRQLVEHALGPHPAYSSFKEHVRFVARNVDGILEMLGPSAHHFAFYQEAQRELVVCLNLLNRWGTKATPSREYEAAAHRLRFHKVDVGLPSAAGDAFEKLAAEERKANKASR